MELRNTKTSHEQRQFGEIAQTKTVQRQHVFNFYANLEPRKCTPTRPAWPDCCVGATAHEVGNCGTKLEASVGPVGRGECAAGIPRWDCCQVDIRMTVGDWHAAGNGDTIAGAGAGEGTMRNAGRTPTDAFVCLGDVAASIFTDEPATTTCCATNSLAARVLGISPGDVKRRGVSGGAELGRNGGPKARTGEWHTEQGSLPAPDGRRGDLTGDDASATLFSVAALSVT